MVQEGCRDGSEMVASGRGRRQGWPWPGRQDEATDVDTGGQSCSLGLKCSIFLFKISIYHGALGISPALPRLLSSSGGEEKGGTAGGGTA